MISNITNEQVGNYVVVLIETKTNYTAEHMMGEHLMHNGKSVRHVYAPMQICEYHGGIDYKIILKPIGPLRDFIIQRPWYTCDIESRLRMGDAEYFEDPIEAWQRATALNDEIFKEEKKENKIIKFFKEIFRQL